MKRTLLALILLLLAILPARTDTRAAGQGGQACNQFAYHGIYYDSVNGSYVYDWWVTTGVGNFCWQFFARVPGSYAAPDRQLSPWLFLPPPAPNNRPHGALVSFYQWDLAAIQAHQGSRPLPAFYTFDDGNVLQVIALSDPVFPDRLNIGDVVVWDVFAQLEYTAGGPGGHYQPVWGISALYDFQHGWLVPLPAHSGY